MCICFLQPGRPGRQGTVKWLLEHLDDPLWQIGEEGVAMSTAAFVAGAHVACTLTVIQALYVLVLWKHQAGVGDTAFDMLLRVLHQVVQID